MKTRLSQRFAALCMGVLLCSSTLMAQVKYCNETLKSAGNQEISLSCYEVSDGMYEIKIETDAELAGLGGSFVHVNGTEPFELRNKAEISADKKTIIIPITSSTPPSPYTPLYVLMPGEEVFDWNYNIDWNSDCGGILPGDTEAPTAFTVTKGVETHNSIELLLNATDNSGSVTYVIEFNGQTQTVKGISGTEKSYYVTGLSPETSYTFSVTAKDASNNVAANSPLQIAGTTTVSNITGCEGTDKEASEGSFDAGYRYSLTTTGGEVTVEFEILDNKDGLVAFAFTYNPDFAEVQMDNVGGNKFAKTFTGQTPGSTFKVACKFAFAGGLAITKTFELIVGQGCGVSDMDLIQKGETAIYPNPVTDVLHINSDKEINRVFVTNLLGQTILEQNVNNERTIIDMSVYASGNYLVTVTFSDGERYTKKVIK